MDGLVEAILGRDAAKLLGFEPKTTDYPCQAEPMDDPPPRLMTFLYLLARDKLPVGEIEALMISARDATGTQGCNPHLDQLARSYCQVLVGGEHETMQAAHIALEGVREQLETAGLWKDNGPASLASVIAELQHHRAQSGVASAMSSSTDER